MKTTAEISVDGKDLNALLARATKQLTEFYGDDRWKITEVRAQPFIQELGGKVISWKADVYAEAT
jgi:hypothetical protein